jgi:Neutral/alkaline non-lysosomal ceramidase, N-terminal
VLRSIRASRLAGAALVALFLVGVAPSQASAGPLRAGASVVDATWHVGASAGQYASDGEFASVESTDPTQHSTRRAPSYGVQSRLQVRALVVEGPDGKRFALVKTDFYIPQDLIWRYAAELIANEHIGIDKHNFTMAITHDHSSPMYQSTSWGVWAFQDVFDFRFFHYMGRKMRDAVKQAASRLEPVKVGASVTQYAFPQRNVPGTAVADDGTPAGFPNDYTDHDLIVTRFDSVRTGKPIANLVNYAVHPEDLEGNDLISADYVGHVQRFTDRQTGAVTIWTQGAVGNTEPEDNRWHDIHARAYFSHAQYAQSEFEARGIASQIVDTSNDVEKGTPEDPQRFAPIRTSFEPAQVRFVDRWFPGPASHPYPGVSSCRTDSALQGDPRAPIVGLPDCQATTSEVGAPNPIRDAGITTDTIQDLGLPVPENYSAPAYTGLEEDVSVHLQAFRIGDILFTVCSCEQWADQSKDIKTRTDRVQGDQWIGYDWYRQCTQDGNGTYGGGTKGFGTGTWTCPNPGGGQLKALSDKLVQRMHAQVVNPANGWDSLANAPVAESEPTDLRQIWGNYTHDDTSAAPTIAQQRADAAALGYKVTVAMSMANDYNGYIATYREYQRGDHYRKALTAWGPHSSDYMATRLVKMGRYLHQPDRADGKPAQGDPFPLTPNPAGAQNDVVSDLVEWPGGGQKVTADLAFNDRRANGIGRVADTTIPAYEAQLPDDTPAKIVKEPGDVQRFGAAFFRWNGGSNYTDNPEVVVQRRVGSRWVDYAGQEGELPVTMKFPKAEEIPAYRQGGFDFQWTAHFEAFVAPFELIDRPRATPPGTYRFVVDGKRRQGGAVRSYHLESRTFQVERWAGITVEDLKSDNGVVSFRVGPRHVRGVPNGPPMQAELGPIDYPDSYARLDMAARYIDPHRWAFRDPDAPTDPSKVEWYCRPDPDDDALKRHGCSFRPWLDTGDAERAIVTFVDSDGDVRRVSALPQGDRWVAARKLGGGEAAYVESGDVCDHWTNFNGAPTATIGSNVAPKNPPAGYSCLAKQTGGGGGGNGGGGGHHGGSGGGGGTAGDDHHHGKHHSHASNPLHVPGAKECKDRRKFSWHIHQPPGRRIVAVNLYVNGKRKLHKEGHRITHIRIKRLPKGKFTIKIVALVNTGERVISVRKYDGCKKGRPHTHVEQGR